MMEKINGIVLENRKHSDSVNIVTLYTRSRGRMSFISPVSASAKRRGRGARLLPLALVDTELNIVAGKELQRLPSVATPYPWQDIYFNPVKSTIVIFLSEFLSRVLRDSAPDPAAWDFICDSLRLLDGMQGSLSNFHISFLINFLHFAGIRPDVSEWRPGCRFSLESAEFSSLPVGGRQYLSEEESAVLPLLSRMTYCNMGHFRLNGGDRRRILEGLLRFYALHYPGADNLKSLEVLKEVYS